MLIFRCIFLINYWWQKSDIWSQASYRYAILWEVLLDPIQNVCSMCIKINKVGKQEIGIWWIQKRLPRYEVLIWNLWPNIRSLPYTLNIHLYMHIFRPIFLSNCWWQESDIWSQASYRYAILWEVLLDPSDSYFPFADFVGFYTHWTYIVYAHFYRQTGSRNLTSQKTLPTIWGTYMKLVTKY
jgi:hypothetical protein